MKTARASLSNLSRRERQIMEIVYSRGAVSARDVEQNLPSPPTYSAVRAALSLLERKGLLRHVRQCTTLTDIALDTGYPDSTHFSHSIRQVYGLRPSDILAGSRRLALHQ